MKEFFKMLGFRSLGPDLSSSRPEDRAKLADRHLHGAQNEEARRNFKESMRILKLEGYTPAAKLRLPETRELRLKDGTAWLNLVLSLYDQDKSILVEVLDLPSEVRRVLTQEKEKRTTMPEAKQKILDAAAHDIEKKGIFNVSMPQASAQPPAEHRLPHDHAA